MRKLILPFVFMLIGLTAFSQNKSYTFVFLNNKPDKEMLSKEKSDSIMQGHMDNIGRLAKEGKLLAAGPFEGGGGIFILNTKSVDEANQWLASDPGVKAKRWNLEVLPYTITTGSICPVGEEYTMVFYQFVRMQSEASSDTKELFSALQKLQDQSSVIHSGVFGNKENLGGIIILKPEVVVVPSAVKGHEPKLEIKKLYIAKGSFCEK